MAIATSKNLKPDNDFERRLKYNGFQPAMEINLMSIEIKEFH